MQLLILFFLIPFSHALADQAPNPDTEEREQCQLALAEEVSGDVAIISPDGTESKPVVDSTVQPGDTVHTGPNSWIDLRLCDGTGMRVGEKSSFDYVAAENETVSLAAWVFGLARGTLRAAVVNSGGSDRVKFSVRTKTAAMGVRGTEFVIDTADDGEQQTTLHTIDGEVLMGASSDFDKLHSQRGAELNGTFEAVSKEKMSLIRRNENRPLRAAQFKMWEFAAERRALLSRPLPKKGWTEIRERFRTAHRQLRNKRAERPLFQRVREKNEEKMESPAKERVQQWRSGSAPRPEAIQEKQEKREERRQLRRQNQLNQQLQKNQQQAMDKRLKKGWRKNLHNQPQSPRQPELNN